mmetsp:Transcript_478/g.1653  ORF Transcript_478/g.1653 Transcript_478/m.1653 type:complete len:393 (+) Transcript_478:195-1373(+)|eukprot:CAMPEP_0198732824 /NCGR_PEP_ID=MMETSP1475-20131203/39850_1 /TAXON_ID= ORGANISM="Unidentified sp., Strain CCMP1999" /NCGR_SAMPLE_ID=MMETSP1475 /ASSEMBLY_ACC=CAM_ASM_001111 /LENGTH=392 /DNA_ID=CAMNT_0044496001 /DNA_START=122 /DNA_END=1300 /DNA_ORIENTATION=+
MGRMKEASLGGGRLGFATSAAFSNAVTVVQIQRPLRQCEAAGARTAVRRTADKRRCVLAAIDSVGVGSDGRDPEPLKPEATEKREKKEWMSVYKKMQRRTITGCIMGVIVTTWIMSGTLPFALGMVVFSVLGQLEYYRMVQAKGHNPSVKMGLLSTTLIIMAAYLTPRHADAMLPICGTITTCYLLLRRKKVASIADIATTLLGIFYTGYCPSFYVRLHGFDFGGAEFSYLGRSIRAIWPSWLPSAVIRTGTITTYWTFLSEVTADCGAFFVGRAFGRTPLSEISPKKTIEGAMGGFVCSMLVSMLGAGLLQWPMWYITGLMYGLIVGVMGLLGDLTASLFKRDAGFKDSGDILPGHGGILDRTDSYTFVAPLVYFFVSLVIPLFARAAGIV